MATDSDSEDCFAFVFHNRSCVYTHWVSSLGRIRQRKCYKIIERYLCELKLVKTTSLAAKTIN